MAPRQRICTTQPSTLSDNDRSSSAVVSSSTTTTPPPVLVKDSPPREHETLSSSSSAAAAAEVARERHDIFNLVVLVPLNVLTLANYDWTMLLSGKHGFVEAWTGNYFNEYWNSFLLYFLVDLVWVSLVPLCVKSPKVIIQHHLFAMVYLAGPIYWPQYEWAMGICTMVEINTWFLIARRIVYKRNELIPTAISDFIKSMFYLSWIGIRIVLYPHLLILYCHIAKGLVDTTGMLLHSEMIFIPIHSILCGLNLKWSYDLFVPIVRRWWLGGDNKMKPTSRLSSGL